MNATRIAHASLFALAALFIAWYGVFAPSVLFPRWFTLGVMLIPLLPVLGLVVAGHRKAAFWGGVLSMFYFSHGVMEAWTSPEVRALALAEVVLSLAVIIGASWDGMRARFNRPRP